MSFRRRTYPEVLDGLITGLTAGVAAEPHPFPPPGGAAAPPYDYPLERPPAADVTAVWGSRAGQPHSFRKGKDWVLTEDGAALRWPEGADLPDPGTVFEVSYLPRSARPSLTDVQTGSVVRTLAESFALELARLSAQLEGVYRSGFVDLAEGSALDNVVALLGVERIRAGRPAGEVEFTRAEGSRGAIHIPAGTRLLTADGEIEYETTAAVTLADGQRTVRTAARDLEPNDPLAAGALTVLPAPIAGIAGVTNPAPTSLSSRDEADEELRERARGFLHGSERATLGALQAALARQGVRAEISEPAPGLVEVTPLADSLTPEQVQRLHRALQDARPAGVEVRLKGAAAPRRVDLSLALTTTQGLLEEDLRGLQEAVRGKVAAFLARLGTDEEPSLNRLVGQVLSVSGVEDVRALAATWQEGGVDVSVLDAPAGLLRLAGHPTVLGELDLADPALPTLLDVVITWQPGTEPADAAAATAALTEAVAYWNTAPQGDAGLRTITFGKLLLVLPLPGKPGESLAGFDQAVTSGAAVALPDAASIAPYEVTFAISQRGGLTQALAAAEDAYPLTASERLALNGVEATERSDE
jgi:hypothetical protein